MDLYLGKKLKKIKDKFPLEWAWAGSRDELFKFGTLSYLWNGSSPIP